MVSQNLFSESFSILHVNPVNNNIIIQDPAIRLSTAAALRAIAVRASNQFGDGGSHNVWIKKVLPLAYLGRNDKEAGSLFTEVWDEGGTVANMKENRCPFAMQLQEKILPHLTKALIGALDEVSWDRRVLACKCLSELCYILAPAPRPIHQESFADEDLRKRDFDRAVASKNILSTCVKLIVKSRSWRGKEDLVKITATIAGNWSQENVSTSEINPISQDGTWDDLFVNDSWFRNIHQKDEYLNEVKLEPSDAIKNKKQTSKEATIDFTEGDKILYSEDNADEEMTDLSSSYPVSYSGLCRVLQEEGMKISSKVRNKTFYSSDMLPYRASALSALSHLLKSSHHAKYLRHLYSRMAGNLIDIISSEVDDIDKVPPLILARTMDCLGSLMWKGIRDDGNNECTKIEVLMRLFTKNCVGETQIAWTLREASAIAASKFVFCAEGSTLRRIEVLDDLINCSELYLKDNWKVRLAKLKILSCLCSRSGNRTSIKTNDTNEMQLMLEALLPLKERMTIIAKSSLTDAESKVTAMASEIIASMAWWP